MIPNIKLTGIITSIVCFGTSLLWVFVSTAIHFECHCRSFRLQQTQTLSPFPQCKFFLNAFFFKSCAEKSSKKPQSKIRICLFSVQFLHNSPAPLQRNDLHNARSTRQKQYILFRRVSARKQKHIRIKQGLLYPIMKKPTFSRSFKWRGNGEKWNLSFVGSNVLVQVGPLYSKMFNPNSHLIWSLFTNSFHAMLICPLNLKFGYPKEFMYVRY